MLTPDALAELADASRHPLERSRGQMSPTQYFTVASALLKHGPCPLVVFGAGYDTKLWAECNQGGETVVIENQPNWIRHAQGVPGVRVIPVSYSSTVGQGLSVDRNVIEWLEPAPPRPTIVIVDGPAGYARQTPGRVGPIRWAAKHVVPGGLVFVHDYHRSLEILACGDVMTDWEHAVVSGNGTELGVFQKAGQ